MNHKGTRRVPIRRTDSPGGRPRTPWDILGGHPVTDGIDSIRYVRFMYYSEPEEELDFELDLSWENF